MVLGLLTVDYLSTIIIYQKDTKLRGDKLNTIVYPPTIDYNWLFQRPQQLLTQLSKKGFKVVFYNNDAYVPQKSPIIQLNENMILCNKSIKLDDVLDRKDFFLYLTYPPHVVYTESKTNMKVIYDSIDDASHEFSHWRPYIPQLRKQSDIILASSKKIYNEHKSHHTDVHLCPNGADYPHFAKAQQVFSKRPKDLPQNERLTVGYIGAIASWLDWKLLHYIVYKNKEINFVFIGPMYNRVKNLVKGKNVYYLGRKDYRELPSYLQYIDACIIPFKINSMTQGCNPIKVYEYLSAGKPVIATNMRELKDITQIYLADSVKKFHYYIQKALYMDQLQNKISRIEIAKRNSWESRANLICGILRRNFK